MTQRLLRTFLALFLLITLPIPSSTFPSQSQTPSSPPASANNISSSSTPTTQYLEIPILEDDAGLYYVNVTWKNATNHHFEATDFGFLSSKPGDYASEYTGKMLLSLYSNNSFVSTCTNFIPYECPLLECQTDNYNTYIVSYLMDGMEVKGYPVDIGMETPAFSICGYSLIYAQTCGIKFPTGISGFLGFGFYPNAFFQVNQNFSIFLSNGQDSLQSTLYVGAGDDTQRIDQTKNFSYTSRTDSNWMISLSGIQAQAETQERPFLVNIKTPTYLKALFDLNTDAIGLPYDLFNNITAVLQAYGLVCDGMNSKANCNYTGELSSLPTFYLLGEESSANSLELNPQVYLAPGDNETSYILQLEGVASEVPGRVKVNPEYDNTIILGRPFLKQYYVHFSVCADYKQPFVTIYYANHANVSHEKTINIKLIIIIAGSSLVGIIVLGVIVCICIKNRRKTKVKDSRKEEEERDNNWRQNFGSTISKTMSASIKQPLMDRTPETNRHTDLDPKSGTKRSRLWSNEKRKYSDKDTHEIRAYTYQKQKFGGLYESVSDYSLNDTIEEH